LSAKKGMSPQHGQFAFVRKPGAICCASAPRQFDVIVLGAGAAGLMCAAVAGQRGRRVALLEHNGQPGRKILISGGGRCNFTNLHCGPGTFSLKIRILPSRRWRSISPGTLSSWSSGTESPGMRRRWGSSSATVGAGDSRDAAGRVRAGRRGACAERARRLRSRARAADFGGVFAGRVWADALVVATGGLSIPKLGATGLGYELARQFGLEGC
jgi:glycine/D-amino acid oxidase-like deaminating enzyme